MSDRSILFTIFREFALLSCIAIGGVVTVIPEMHRVVVDTHQWMTSEAFVTLYALAQAAPGPNVIVVTLIGWQIAGGMGALVATVAICAPSFLMAYAASRVWTRVNDRLWYKIFERGIAPVTIGLVLASGLLLAKGAASGWASYAVTGVTALYVATTRSSPLPVLGAAALLGLTGVI